MTMVSRHEPRGNSQGAARELIVLLKGTVCWAIVGDAIACRVSN